MSDTKTNVKYNGISLSAIIGAAFIVLKLAGVTQIASWNWIWVLSPFWIPLALVLVFLIGLCIIALIVALCKIK